MSAADLRDRVTELERRVASLEGAGTGAPRPPSGEVPDTGMVGYHGEVDLAGAVVWRIEYAAASVLELDADALARVLEAVAHPARIAILRRLLRGAAGATDLREALSDPLGDVSSGQLYHHLRALDGAGLVTKGGRNRYQVAAPGVVPVLVLMLAAGDLAGRLVEKRLS